MADNFSLCLIGAMDRLWFHRIILFPEPFSLFSSPKILKPQQPYSEFTATSPLSSPSATSLAEDSSASVCPLRTADDSKHEEEEEEEEEEVKKRPRRGSLSSNRSRSHSSSPSTQKRRQRNHRHSTSCSLFGDNLQKSMSCRSLKDLELEEVKGLMDLGFTFKKEHLNSRMINVVPGLLRLGFFKTTQKTDELNLDHELPKEDDIEQEEERVVIRPYLSEAWLIKRPDSPLLNLVLPRVSATADMKKHLKFWARTVASVVKQEC